VKLERRLISINWSEKNLFCNIQYMSCNRCPARLRVCNGAVDSILDGPTGLLRYSLPKKIAITGETALTYIAAGKIFVMDVFLVYFLPHDATKNAVLLRHVFCPSVCLSVTLRYD